MSDWPKELRALRDKEGLTRGQLAARASVGPATIKAYELGQRNPSRQLLSALLDALKADMHTRTRILGSAGFAPDSATPSQRRTDEYFDLPEAAAETFASPLPSCVSNEVMEVLAANALVQRIWGVDLNAELQGPFERSMVSMLSQPRIADRITNWDEAIGLVISILKGHYGGDVLFTEGSNPYFAAALERFLAGDPHYVQRFLALWATTPARQRKLRFAYPVTWRNERAGEMRFHVLVNPADQRGSIVFNDWIPIDEATWTAVRKLGREPAGAADFLAG